MEVRSSNISEVFVNTCVLKIPFYQRGYVWTKNNWEQLFNDTLNIINIQQAGANPEEYFLGSIILKEIPSQDLQEFAVVDGQQRLTTIVLFMKAAALLAGDNASFINRFMQMTFTGEQNPILIPNYNDRLVYNQLITLETPNTAALDKDNRMVQAFDYFVDKLKEARKDPYNISLTNLIKIFSTKVRIVVLRLGDKENAQKIFETINCTGTKLTTGELLKNYLYEESQYQNYESSWKVVFEGENRDYWENDIVKGRLKESHIENFFYRYMLVKMQEPDIKAGMNQYEAKLYRQKGGQFEKFRKLIERFGISKSDAADDIVDYAKIYTEVFKADTLDNTIVRYSGVERLAYFMFLQDAWTMTPYILYIIKNVKSDNERNKIFGYMETYLMRRLICKSHNNNYSDLFSENLIGQHVCTFDGFKNYVNDSNSRGELLMPSDDVVRNAVMTKDLKTSALTVLYMLESKINSDFSEAVSENSASEFSREQIMLQNDNGNWPSADGVSEDDRKALTNTLGNFAIIRGKLKSKTKNAVWADKKKSMAELSTSLQTGRIFSGGLNNFDETIIAKRNEGLADQIIRAWSI